MEDPIVVAAAAALGRPLTDPVRLVGGGRATVLRCHAAPADTVVVKAYRNEPDALRSFANEAAALAFGLAGPRLLAVDRDVPLVVMSDLGTAPSLADRLLGTGAEAARDGLLRWATGLGRLAAASYGREPELAALRAGFDRGHPTMSDPGWHRELHARLPESLDRLAVAAPAGLGTELADLLAAIAPERYPVFSPGDACPDNNLFTEDGLRMIDFEAAGYHCLFLDAAYLRMPFATCWCVFRLPAGLAERAAAEYRREVSVAYPELADDAVWQPGVRHAGAAWTVAMSALLLPRALTGDEPIHPTRRPVATRRQLLRYRWQHAAAELAGAGDLPAVTSLLRRLLDATDRWGVPPLPLYPAFR